MIKTVVRTYHWNPEIISNMYCDSRDYYGIEFWYNDVVNQHRDLESKNKK